MALANCQCLGGERAKRGHSTLPGTTVAAFARSNSPMPRTARGSTASRVYHVLNWGKGRAEAFPSADDQAAMLRIMEDAASERFQLRVSRIRSPRLAGRRSGRSSRSVPLIVTTACPLALCLRCRGAI